MKLLKTLALLMGIMLVGYMVGATVYNISYDSNRDGTSEFSVDTDGNTMVKGTTDLQNSVTIHDILAVSGDTATEAVRIAGAYTTLPTSGYDKYTIVMFIGTDTGFGSPKLCVSTDTVTSASCWVPLH
jgi:TRAP-type C4-dicarboxylate transport system permease large subunit